MPQRSAINDNTLKYRYGTAGFRMDSKQLIPLVDKLAFAVASFAHKTAAPDGAVGIVFTASHNPASENGVKLIGRDGLMAPVEIEELAEQIVNDPTISFGENDSLHGTVLIGRDTRASGEVLVSRFKDIFRKRYNNVKLVDLGLITTPQGHYIVKLVNEMKEPAEAILEGYFKSLTKPFSTPIQQRLVIDCANGVGAVAMRHFIDTNRALLPNLSLINSGEGTLNLDCGADHVKTTGKPPVNCHDAKYGASFDGDADRLIMWYHDSSSGFKVLDGDKLATLFAVYFSEKLNLKTAVVMTAYANGAARLFLESKGVRVEKALTGVKNLHGKAASLVADDGYEAVVYFEGTGMAR
jgi:phosphoacetylglucosamine mutase